ncbi:NOP2-LIKE NUCLEOLAR PROTEIN [Encephalitozoon cuniculi GB-M1]|uniref:NOP2-LIKE NUCLEOLAR PROTEIN n=2 Tax=Encephalitozoon cuniculi TaxID=6035 RepID=Q8SRL8_ENCCU|nr:rRNA (cytosine-C5-)-methyltransferase RCM1 [Encephalitozoon cuniculi GB-M1]AGE96363.1 nop2-like nucleolar protein [Encephalitozoon cuniculi]KMV65755.1 tRNA/rRNA cytosine-C5-methylase [Encephalitozoon cuniculi EcunIII-L]UYI27188.1 rRNA (cytosine-C(5))-methyltransferase [Encephalitozoon cuniculi]CAD25564.1 NOP2-LIKE NUCLEOLAR PROTEIN [Encephalitozoon cuniculi GB-M1]
MNKKESSKLQFDKRCIEMVRHVLEGRSTVKQEVYKMKDPKMYHKLVHMVVENHDLLLDLIKRCKYMEDDRELGVIRCFQILDRRIRNTRMRRKFMKALGGRKLKLTKATVFVRINTLRGGTEEDIGFLDYEKSCVDGVYKILDSKNIVFSEGYKNGKFVIQNISSCLPAHILDPEEGSRVIDTCSAPGNKTSQLAMIMRNTGKIYAFERSKNRAETLRAQLFKLGVSNTEVVEDDFMNANPEDFEGIRYILCDPSCSGSGMHLGYKMDKERIEGLKSFQIEIVRHALRFRPEKLVYSVCSDHREEGEEVVEEILRSSEYELENISMFWSSAHSSGFSFSQDVVRCRRDESGAIGFFIALFVRKK